LVDLLRLHASRGEHDRTSNHRGRESGFPDSRHVFRFDAPAITVSAPDTGYNARPIFSSSI
jgi:hypothetical protein